MINDKKADSLKEVVASTDDFAVIVLNYNNVNETINYVKRISKFETVNKVIVVDNCSPNNDYELLLQLLSNKVFVIKTESNRGYSYGNNVGIKYVFKHWPIIDIIFISNPDIIITNKTFDLLKNFLRSNADCAVVSGYIHSLNDENVCAWHCHTWWDYIFDMFRLRALRHNYLSQRGIYTGKYLNEQCKEKSVVYVDCIMGCFFGIKKSFLNKIGLFDVGTFLYIEDILGIQVKNMGLHEVVLSNVEIVHIGGTSTTKTFNTLNKNLLQMNSIVYVLQKYLHCNKLQVLIYKYIRIIKSYMRCIISHIKILF
jgi:GT2 family glycosyltransferase